MLSYKKTIWLLAVSAIILTAGFAHAEKDNRFILEKMAEDAYAKIKFVAPNSFLARHEVNYTEEKKHLSFIRYSFSSFLVVYRERQFLLTASHVWSKAFTDSEYEVAYVQSKWIRLPPRSSIKFMTSIDIAALEVTKLLNKKIGGLLKPEIEDLELDKSLLLTACNPLRFASYFVGVFHGLKTDGTGRIRIKFAGDGARSGCSGSPVVDELGFIRGLIVGVSDDERGNVVGDMGYAVRADHIIEFLEQKFFKN